MRKSLIVSELTYLLNSHINNISADSQRWPGELSVCYFLKFWFMSQPQGEENILHILPDKLLEALVEMAATEDNVLRAFRMGYSQTTGREFPDFSKLSFDSYNLNLITMIALTISQVVGMPHLEESIIGYFRAGLNLYYQKASAFHRQIWKDKFEQIVLENPGRIATLEFGQFSLGAKVFHDGPTSTATVQIRQVIYATSLPVVMITVVFGDPDGFFKLPPYVRSLGLAVFGFDELLEHCPRKKSEMLEKTVFTD